MIDAHLHAFERQGEEERLLSAMDAGGVARSVLLPLPPLRFQDACTAGNERVYDLCRRHRDRLSFGVFVDPRDGNAIDTLRRYADLGAMVIKLYPPLGFYPDDGVCMRLYEAAVELKLPILSHTGATDLTYWDERPRSALASHWADPIRFDGLARQFPEITWILAHMGFPWSVNAWYVSCVNPNVYLDVAGGGMWSTALVPLYNSIGREIPIDFTKVLWGSDNCLPPVEHIPFARNLLLELGCRETDLPNVFGETARRLFRFGPDKL